MIARSIISFLLVVFYITSLSFAQSIEWTDEYTETNGAAVVDMMTDDEGNIYVVGNVIKGGKSTEIAILKYNSNGNLDWDKVYSGGGGPMADEAISMAIDNTNDCLYVLAQLHDTTQSVVLKYNYQGFFQWDEDVYGEACLGRNLAVDNAGDVYVAMLDEGLRINKVSSAGNLLWSRIESLIGLVPSPVTIKLDAGNNIYVAGYFDGTFANGGFITKLDSDGYYEWHSLLAPGAEAWSAFVAIDFLSTGDVVAGGSYIPVGETSMYHDIIARCFSPVCDTLWTYTYGELDNSEYLSSLMVNNDTVYITGQLMNPPEYSYNTTLILLSDAGTPINQDIYNRGAAVEIEYQGRLAAYQDKIYIPLYSTSDYTSQPYQLGLLCYNSEGQFQWDIFTDGITDYLDETRLYSPNVIASPISANYTALAGTSGSLPEDEAISTNMVLFGSPNRAWHVDPAGSDLTGEGTSGNPFETIQHAIDLASDNDTILVHEGNYNESIIIDKPLIVSSDYINTGDTTTIENTVLDGQNADNTIVFINNGGHTLFKGFTVTGCLSNASLPELYPIYATGPGDVEIVRNIIRDNECRTYGALAIAIYGSGEAIIDSNIIHSNFQTIDLDEMCFCPVIDYQDFAGTEGPGGSISYNRIYNNTFKGGGAINIVKRYPEVQHNVIVNNQFNSSFCSHPNMGVIYSGILNMADRELVIKNNIIANNTGDLYGITIFSQLKANIDIDFNDIFGHVNGPYGSESGGDHDIYCGPLFCDSATGNFANDAISCCVASGCDESGNADEKIDIGMPGIGCISDQYTVGHLRDSGPGSFREVLDSVNANGVSDTVNFLRSGIIYLQTPLPLLIDDNTVIQGGSAPDGDNSVILDGSSLTKSINSGLRIQSSGNLIEGLVFTGFTGNGIEITGASSTKNTLSRNLVYNNGLLGIDLGDDGVTVNDPFDADTGPNDLLNTPYIDSVFMNPDSSFNFYGTNRADSAVIEFFVAHPGNDGSKPEDPTGHGEAYQYIGTDTANNFGSFNFVIPNTVPLFSRISMTATDTLGNTSEFGENFTLTPAPLIIVGYSPINLQVTDPHGGFIGRDAFGTLTQTIYPASYTDIVNDSIHIDYPLEGEYIIDVIGEDGADPGAVYSIGIRIDGTANCIIVEDALIPAEGEVTSYSYEVEEGYHYLNGDANRDEVINLLDILYLIDYKYKHGPEPYPVYAADADCNLVINLLDILYLIDYKFKEGPEPCPLTE